MSLVLLLTTQSGGGGGGGERFYNKLSMEEDSLQQYVSLNKRTAHLGGSLSPALSLSHTH